MSSGPDFCHQKSDFFCHQKCDFCIQKLTNVDINNQYDHIPKHIKGSSLIFMWNSESYLLPNLLLFIYWDDFLPWSCHANLWTQSLWIKKNILIFVYILLKVLPWTCTFRGCYSILIVLFKFICHALNCLDHALYFNWTFSVDIKIIDLICRLYIWPIFLMMSQ